MKQLRIIIVVMILFVSVLPALPAAAQAPTTQLKLETPAGLTTNGFRFSPPSTSDNNFTCTPTGGGGGFSVTGSGTMAAGVSQAGCEIFLGTTQPTNTVGISFRISSYSNGGGVSTVEHDSTGNQSLSAHDTTGVGETAPTTICITDAGFQTRVQNEVTGCDSVQLRFIPDPGGTRTGFTVNGWRQTNMLGSPENITFQVDFINWIVEDEQAPPQDPTEPPPNQDINIPVPITGLEPTCYECPNPDSFLQVHLWLAKLICVIRNLFTCALRIWLLDIVNALNGLYNNIVGFFVWVADTVQGSIAWVFSLSDKIVKFVRINWEGVIKWVAKTFNDMISPVITGLKWVAKESQNFINYVTGSIDSTLQFFADIYNGSVMGFMDTVNGVILTIVKSDIYQGVINSRAISKAVFKIVTAYITLFMDVATQLYSAVLVIIDITVDIAEALFTVTQDNGTIDIDQELGLAGFDALELEQDGINGSKVLWLFLNAMGGVDFALSRSQFVRIREIIIATMSLFLLIWTLDKWKDILPI